MTLSKTLSALLTASALLLTPAAGPLNAFAADTTAVNLPAGVQREAIEQIVREYLLKNPEIMLEVQDALEQKQKERQDLARRQVLEEEQDKLFDSAHDGVIGNPDASITVVEFFDYNCGYCKRALNDMQALVEENDDVRFVLKEFPILSPESKDAHVVSMAVHAVAPEKYPEFHQQLLGGKARANGELAMKIATGLGVDEGVLRQEMEDPKIQQIFDETYQLANKLAVSGTPAYVVGDEVVFGALGKKVLQEKIETARACVTAEC